MITPESVKVGTELHRKLSNAVQQRLRLSQNMMSQRYTTWAENEELFNAYITTKDSDKLKKSAKKSAGEIEYVTIEVPYTYAIALTAHTYYTSVFLARNPIFQFTGRHGEAENKVLGVEAVMDYQLTVGRMLMPLYLWMLDPLKYGVGFIGHYWDDEEVPVTKRVDIAPTFGGLPIPFAKPKSEYQTVMTRGYSGNRMYNIRPQDAFPDPRVSLWNFQAGEFFARYVEIPIAELFAGVASERYFNVAAAIEMQKQTAGRNMSGGIILSRDMGGRGELLPTDDSTYISQPNDIPIGILKGYEIYLRLIPNQWGFSDSGTYEIWVITISQELVIMACRPLGDPSNQFPADILEHEPNGYSFFSRSMMEIAKPLNDVISWLVNSHFYNVRASLNNQFVIDPSMIETSDLTRPGPGKMFRLTPAAYGRGVDLAIKQFPVGDVTQKHIDDMQVVGDLIQRIFGVSDNVMGMVNPGGRKTATEIRTSTSLAVNRLKTQCEMMSAMGFSPLAQKLLQRTQANHTFERTYRVIGDLIAFGDPFTTVDLEQLAGNYDFIPVDGTMPVDRFAQATLWQNLMSQAAQIPQISMQYDFGKVFAWVATLAGAKNIQQFRLNIQVGDDAKLMAGMQEGNVVPIKPGTIGSSGIPMQPQQPGMGQTA